MEDVGDRRRVLEPLQHALVPLRQPRERAGLCWRGGHSGRRVGDLHEDVEVGLERAVVQVEGAVRPV